MAIQGNSQALLTIKAKVDGKAEIKGLESDIKGVGNATKGASSATKEHAQAVEQARSSYRQLLSSLNSAERGVNQLTGSVRVAGGAFQQLRSFALGAITGIAGTLAGVSLGSALQEGVEGAVAFQRNLIQVQNLTNASAEDIQRFRDSVKQLSADTLTSGSDLAEGFNVVASAGIQGAAGLDLLEQSAKASVIGLGTTEDIARTAAAALVNFGDAGLTATGAMDILVETANAGNFEVSELAGTLGKVLPTARAAGADFRDIGGAIATLTVNGLPAAQAVDYLNALFVQLNRESPEARKILAQVGLTFGDLRKEITEKGLLSAVTTLYDRLGRNNANLTAVLQDQGAVSVVQQLMGNLQMSTELFAQVEGASGGLGRAFSNLADSDYGKLLKAQAEFKSQMTELGAEILPTFVAGLKFVSENLDTLRAILVVVVAMMGAAGLISAMLALIEVIPLVVTGIGILTGAFTALDIAMMANPIGAVVAAIILLVGVVTGLVLGLKALYDNFAVVKTGVDLVVSAFQALWSLAVFGVQTVGAIIGIIREAIVMFAQWVLEVTGIADAWDQFLTIMDYARMGLEAVWGVFVNFLSANLAGPIQFVTDAWNAMKVVLGLLWEMLKNAFTGVMDFLGANFPGVMSSWVAGLLPVINQLKDLANKARHFWRAVRGEDVGDVGDAPAAVEYGPATPNRGGNNMGAFNLRRPAPTVGDIITPAGRGGGGGRGNRSAREAVTFASETARLTREIAAATYTENDAHSIQEKLLQVVNRLKQAKVTLTEQETDALKAQIVTLRDTEAASAFYAAQNDTLRDMAVQTRTLTDQLGQNADQRERSSALAKVEADAVRAHAQNVAEVVARYAEAYDAQARIKRLGTLANKVIDNSEAEALRQYQQTLADLVELQGTLAVRTALGADATREFARAARDARIAYLGTRTDAASGLELGRLQTQQGRDEGDAGRAASAYADQWNTANQALLEMRANEQALIALMADDPLNSGHYALELTKVRLEAANLRVDLGDGTWQEALMGGLSNFVDSYRGVVGGLRDAWGGFFDSFASGFADSIGAAIVQGESLGDTLGNVARGALQELISALVKVGLQWVVMQALGATLGATSVAVSATQAAATATAWAPAAAMASLATLGANAIPAGAALASTTALASALALIPGFSEGGFTGMFGRDKIAGVVHGQEYVLNADATARIGRDKLDAINSGRLTGGQALAAASNDNGGGVALNVEVHNYSSAAIQVERLSSGDVRIIAREEAEAAVLKKTPAVVAKEVADPNSKTSKALSRHTSVGRRRDGS